MEKTLVIIKPDGVKRKLIGEILSRFERKNLNITNLKMTKLKKEVVEEHYAHHKDKPFFRELVEYMCESEVVIAIVEGEDAIAHVRNLIGSTKAIEAAPGTIRGDFAYTNTQNLVHGSDSPESAEIEIKRFFPELWLKYLVK